MRARNLILTAVAVGALLFACVAGAQQVPADGGGQGGGRRGGNAGQRGGGAQGNQPAGAPNADNQFPGGMRGMTMEQMQQRMQEMQQRYDEQMKTALEMTDMEWLALDAKIRKVQTLQRELSIANGSGVMVGPAPRRMDVADSITQTEVTKAMQELQAAVDNKDSTAEEITAKLQALRDARAKLPEELAQARADMLAGLTPRQESQLVLMGFSQ